MDNYRLDIKHILLVIIMIVLVVGLLNTSVLATSAVETIAEDIAITQDVSRVSWLEPRGMNVVDLVGILPEDVLRGSIVTWIASNGIAQYESGSRYGDSVSLSVSYSLADTNLLLCLGEITTGDEYPSSVPEMSMRVFDGTIDVTARVMDDYTYVPAGYNQPENPPDDYFRYDKVAATFTRNNDGSILVPANIGCEFRVDGATLANPRAEFAFSSPTYISVEEIYRTTPEFHSYIGVGAGANLSSLKDQMWSRFGFRHDGWKPSVYDADELRTQLFEADYIFVKYPPQPVNPWVAAGLSILGSGNYRVMFSNGAQFKHGAGYSNSVLAPFHTQWEAIANNDIYTYQPTFKVFDRRTADVSPYQVHDEIKSLEYFLPPSTPLPNIPYHPCMTNGDDCSNTVLDNINDATYEAEIYFYKVERIYPNLTQIPLRLVGNGYSGRDTNIAPAENIRPNIQPKTLSISDITSVIYLPMVETPFIIPDDNPNAGCPCGWFDEQGRMFDFVPAP